MLLNLEMFIIIINIYLDTNVHAYMYSAEMFTASISRIGFENLLTNDTNNIKHTLTHNNE